MSTRDDLAARDARVVWHPYTQHATDPEPLVVRAAHGALLELGDGRAVIDAISSWWCCLHGHGRSEIAAAIADQATRLDQVQFAGCTHEPAVRLAERLVELAPRGLSRVFFSDDGSTAVEVALKMALQAHADRGEPQRRVFVALDGGYHGDTFGAMAVGDPDPFFAPFRPLLFEVRRVPASADAVSAALADLGPRAAGVVIEPLVQGAAGMRMHDGAFVRAVRAACDERRVPLIADEVMTGFGRTGAVFACERAGVVPDHLCISKGLSGGTLPIAATLVREEVFAAFRSSDRRRTFFHGHTFTGNPIACAASLASLDLFAAERTHERVDAIGRRIEAALLAGCTGAVAERVHGLRRIGGIVAFDIGDGRGGYLRSLPAGWREVSLAHGVLLRPLGNVLYAMPPSCTSEAQCDTVAAAMLAVASL